MPHRPDTIAVHGGEDRRKPFNSLTTPVVFGTSFPFTDGEELDDYMQGRLERGNEYIRYGHPTVRSAEKKLAAIEGAEDALLYASGMSAITIAIMTVIKGDQHIVITNDSYRKTRVFVRQFLSKFAIDHTVCDPDLDSIQAAINDRTKLIVSESPTNPFLRCPDLRGLAELARSKRIKTLIDTTLASPANLRPLDYGIDMVVHSCTKYLGGHNDLMAGVILGKEPLISGLREAQGMFGALPGPMTAYLLIRGLKTFPLRMRHFNDAGMRIARFLEEHPLVERVWYPGLESHPDHHLAARDMDGFGGVISFTTKGDRASTSAFVDHCELPRLAPTFGGPESLIGQPALVSYYEMDPEQRVELGITDNLVRLCLGLEDAEDVIADLDQALRACIA